MHKHFQSIYLSIIIVVIICIEFFFSNPVADIFLDDQLPVRYTALRSRGIICSQVRRCTGKDHKCSGFGAIHH